MRAAQIITYSENLDIKVNSDVPTPELDDNQVLIEVYAAALNPFDVALAKGYVQKMIALRLPSTLGGDFAGVIKELGKDTTDFKVGEQVYGQAKFSAGKGAFAEFAAADSSVISAKPQSINFSEAVALPLTAVSAYQVLIEHMQLKVGQKILIHGGAGGIGTMAIQLAKHLGSYVATTAATDEQEYVKQLGADEVIDYQTQAFEELLEGYDAVFDTVGGETYQRSFKVLKPGGVIVSMLEQPNEELTGQYRVKAIAQATQVTTERLVEVTKLVDAGMLKPKIDKSFPLEQIGEALEHLRSGRPKGKVVIEIKKKEG